MSAGVSAAARRQLGALAESQPESAPWLALVAEALREADDPAWDRAAAGVALRADQPAPVPLLAGATIPVEPGTAQGWVRRLLALAGNAGPDATALGDAAGSGRLDAAALLEAAINQDGERLGGMAVALGVDRDALAAVAQLAAMPLLQACRRRLAAAVSPNWSAGYCPVCGAWPAMAESRGLERARRLRCGRCGADWGMVSLRCPFCGTTDHQQLATLVSETDGEARRVETCAHCRGYLKTVATLRPWAGDEIGLADLATVDLDLAALERTYARPKAPAVNLGVRLIEMASPVDARQPGKP